MGTRSNWLTYELRTFPIKSLLNILKMERILLCILLIGISGCFVQPASIEKSDASLSENLLKFKRLVDESNNEGDQLEEMNRRGRCRCGTNIWGGCTICLGKRELENEEEQPEDQLEEMSRRGCRCGKNIWGGCTPCFPGK